MFVGGHTGNGTHEDSRFLPLVKQAVSWLLLTSSCVSVFGWSLAFVNLFSSKHIPMVPSVLQRTPETWC